MLAKILIIVGTLLLSIEILGLARLERLVSWGERISAGLRNRLQKAADSAGNLNVFFSSVISSLIALLFALVYLLTLPQGTKVQILGSMLAVSELRSWILTVIIWPYLVGGCCGFSFFLIKIACNIPDEPDHQPVWWKRASNVAIIVFAVLISPYFFVGLLPALVVHVCGTVVLPTTVHLIRVSPKSLIGLLGLSLLVLGTLLT